MSLFDDYGISVRPGKPNAQGLCVYRILNCNGREIGATDACTAEDAMGAIREWLNDAPVHLFAPDALASEPKKEINLGVWNWFGT